MINQVIGVHHHCGSNNVKIPIDPPEESSRQTIAAPANDGDSRDTIIQPQNGSHTGRTSIDPPEIFHQTIASAVTNNGGSLHASSGPGFLHHKIPKQHNNVAVTTYLLAAACIFFFGLASNNNPYSRNYQSRSSSTGTAIGRIYQETDPAIIVKQQQQQQHKKIAHKKYRKATQEEANPPFAQIWPGDLVPTWAKKSVNYEVPNEESICYVHVGKAGGSAVGCALGFSLHCDDDDKPSQIKGILPKLTTNTFHKDVYNCHDNSAYFLFVIRDPIDRARSSIHYDRPDDGEFIDVSTREFYMDCPFWTTEQVVQNGLLNSENHDDASDEEIATSEMCKSRAVNSLKGTTPIMYVDHLFYNYQYYYEAVPQDAPILAIRNEHLIEDWNTIESLLGGRKDRLNNENTIPTLNFYEYSEEDAYISDESRMALCHALCNEIQVYKTLLLKAQNLNRMQKQVSMEELEAKCPEEASVDICPDSMPNISEKLKEGRGYVGNDEQGND